jgi:hypothetical protein
MGIGTSDSAEEFEEQIKAIEEMGFVNLIDEKLFKGFIPYGISTLHAGDDDDDDEVIINKSHNVATNPVIAMAEYWENHTHMAVSSGLTSLINMIIETAEKYGAEEIISTLKKLIDDNGAGMTEIMLKGIYQTQPDVISIGNPHILNNVVSGVIPDGKFSDDVENFLKKVVETEEE